MVEVRIVERTPNVGVDGAYEGVEVFENGKAVEHIEGTLEDENTGTPGSVEERLMVDDGGADVFVVGHELVVSR